MDAANVAVEAFALAGAFAGLKLGPTEKELAKSLVRCAIDGKSALDCTREELVRRMPREVQPFASCMLRGQPIDACATREVVSRLPPQLHGLANCIAKGENIAQCGQRFGIDQLRQAERSALNQAFETFNKLRTDVVAANPLRDSPGALQNIIRVAEGIRDQDWVKVSYWGGVEVYKHAGKILLGIFLPAPLAQFLAPAVDALVQHRAELAANIVSAAIAGDERRLGELAVEAFVYLNLPLVQACALVPSGAVKEAICGLLGEGVAALAGAGGEIVDLSARKAEDAYNAAQDLLTGRREDCGLRDQYYDANFAFCKHHAVMAKHLNPDNYSKIEKSLNDGCRARFAPCSKKIQVTIPNIFGDDFKIGSKSTDDRISDICNPRSTGSGGKSTSSPAD